MLENRLQKLKFIYLTLKIKKELNTKINSHKFKTHDKYIEWLLIFESIKKNDANFILEYLNIKNKDLYRN